MTLFVGHLIERINDKVLRELFSPFGTIANIDRKGTYAFIDLDNKEAAQRAALELDKVEFMGTVLRVELSNRERGQDGPPPGDQNETCYNCQDIGHIAKNCPIPLQPAQLEHLHRTQPSKSWHLHQPHHGRAPRTRRVSNSGHSRTRVHTFVPPASNPIVTKSHCKHRYSASENSLCRNDMYHTALQPAGYRPTQLPQPTEMQLRLSNWANAIPANSHAVLVQNAMSPHLHCLPSGTSTVQTPYLPPGILLYMPVMAVQLQGPSSGQQKAFAQMWPLGPPPRPKHLPFIPPPLPLPSADMPHGLSVLRVLPIPSGPHVLSEIRPTLLAQETTESTNLTPTSATAVNPQNATDNRSDALL